MIIETSFSKEEVVEIKEIVEEILLQKTPRYVTFVPELLSKFLDILSVLIVLVTLLFLISGKIFEAISLTLRLSIIYVMYWVTRKAEKNFFLNDLKFLKDEDQNFKINYNKKFIQSSVRVTVTSTFIFVERREKVILREFFILKKEEDEKLFEKMKKDFSKRKRGYLIFQYYEE